MEFNKEIAVLFLTILLPVSCPNSGDIIDFGKSFSHYDKLVIGEELLKIVAGFVDRIKLFSLHVEECKVSNLVRELSVTTDFLQQHLVEGCS